MRSYRVERNSVARFFVSVNANLHSQPILPSMITLLFTQREITRLPDVVPAGASWAVVGARDPRMDDTIGAGASERDRSA